jgi:cyanophycinase
MVSMYGTVALVGSGEFLEPIEPLDRKLLARINGEARVVVLPTAAAPDGPGVPEHWAQLGIKHFERLGVAVEAVMVLTHEDAGSESLASKITTANFVYLSGGKPQYLLETLRDTVCWRAIESVFATGGVVAGCSAGAMVLAGHLLAWPGMRRSVPALGLAPGIAIIPHFDEIPGWITGIIRHAPSGVTVVGVEGSTGLVGSREQGWTVCGRGSVTVFAGKQKQQYHSGESVPLAAPPVTSIEQ